jgi:hypothetical protein
VAAPPQGVLHDIIRGYANAMFRLGLRYEVRRNDDEALRCYGKASKLGNEDAAARMGELCPDEPPIPPLADPPPPPWQAAP